MINNDFPEKLLYYSKINKYCIDVILKNTFSITDPTRGFNDPLDCFFEVNFAMQQKDDIISILRGNFINENFLEKEKYIVELSDQDQNEIQNFKDELDSCTEEILKQRFSEFATKEMRSTLSKHLRIRSFSAQTADRILNNIMFSHYGDSHKGLCYIFDRKKLIKNTPINSLIKVDYLARPTVIEYKSQNEYSHEELEQIYHNIVKTKYKDWYYENEWRLKINLENPSKKIHEPWEFEPDSLERIVLGLKSSKEDEERIIKLVKKRSTKVNIYKADRRYGSFDLVYENNKIN